MLAAGRSDPFRSRRRFLSRAHEPHDELLVPSRTNALEELAPTGETIALEIVEEGLRGWRAEADHRRDPPLEPGREYLRVANRSEESAEPSDLVSQRIGPVSVEVRPERPEIRAQPPGGDPRLVDTLGSSPTLTIGSLDMSFTVEPAIADLMTSSAVAPSANRVR